MHLTPKSSELRVGRECFVLLDGERHWSSFALRSLKA